MLEAPAYCNLIVTYPTYREQLITEVCQKLLLLRVEHVWRLKPSLGNQRAVDAGWTLHVVVTISMDNSVVDGVDARPLVGGIIAFAYRHHFVLSTVLFFRILHFHCFWFRSARWVESLSPKRYENFFLWEIGITSTKFAGFF